MLYGIALRDLKSRSQFAGFAILLIKAQENPKTIYRYLSQRSIYSLTLNQALSDKDIFKNIN
jgi:hypothetical protein